MKLQITLLVLMLFPLVVGSVGAQNQTGIAIPNTPSTNGTDLTVAGGGVAATAIGLGFAFLKDRMDKKEVMGEIKGTDMDFFVLLSLQQMLNQYAHMFPERSYYQLLQLPATEDVTVPLTISHALGQLTKGTGDYISKAYKTPIQPVRVAPKDLILEMEARKNDKAPIVAKPTT